MNSLRLFPLLIALCPLPLAAEPVQPQFRNLGFAPGRPEQTFPRDVSDRGLTTVGFRTNQLPHPQAQVWRLAGDSEALGVPSLLFAVQRNGSRVVGEIEGTLLEAVNTQLVSNPHRGQGGAGYAVSLSGLIAGNLYSGGIQTACLWSDYGRPNAAVLGYLPGGNNSVALGISGNGGIVVGESNGNNGQQGFRWTAATGLLGLEDLPGGSMESYATAISFDGGTIAGRGRSAYGREATLWLGAAAPYLAKSLGDLPGGSVESGATRVSADGRYIVGNARVASGTVPFIWDAEDGMRPLRDLIVEENGLAFSNLHLSFCASISPDASAVCGWGSNPSEGGRTDGWMAVIKHRQRLSLPQLASFTTGDAALSLPATTADGGALSYTILSGSEAVELNGSVLRIKAPGENTAGGPAIVRLRANAQATDTHLARQRLFTALVNDGSASFEPFGLPAGATTTSKVRGLSNGGGVVVGEESDGTKTQPVVRIGSLRRIPPALAGGTGAGSAFAVSADGLVAAGEASTGGAADLKAARFEADGTQSRQAGDLGTEALSRVCAVSADGKIMAGEIGAGTSQRAARWTLTTAVEVIDSLKTGGGTSVARGLSADGRKVVGAMQTNDSPTELQAFVWDGSAATTQLLGFLSNGNDSSAATACSADASVIVGFSSTARGGVSGTEAARFAPNTAAVSLGDLPGGALDSAALGITGDGLLIVGYGTDAGGRRAAIWENGGGIRALQDVLATDYGLGAALTGWTLTEALAVSPDGFAIAGVGTNPQGRQEGWVARLPRRSVFTLSGAEVSTAENAGPFQLVVAKAPGVRASVTVTVAPGTATAGSDYTAPAPQVLAFDTHETSRTISIPIIDDDRDEEAETFVVTLTSPTSGALLGQAQMIVTITNDDDGKNTPVISSATVPAVTATTATYQATVNPDGLATLVYFKTATSLAGLAGAAREPAGGVAIGAGSSDVVLAPFVKAGLTKGANHFMQVEAVNLSGSETSAPVAFTPLNQRPVAVADTVFLSGTTKPFYPAHNDRDPDQPVDTLKVLAPGEVLDGQGRSLGTLTPGDSGRALTFTASPLFVDSATFQYQAQDDDGLLSEPPGTVTLKRFKAIAGGYLGVVTTTDGAAGTLRLMLTAGGSFSGSLVLAGVKYSFDDLFDVGGTVQFGLEGTNLELVLALHVDGSVTGQLLTAGVATAEVKLDRIDGGGGFSPVAGEYTTFLDLPEASTAAPAGGPAMAIPQGSGYLLMHVGKSRRHSLRLVGQLPDFTKLSAGVDGLTKRRYAVYKDLYKRKGQPPRGEVAGSPEFPGDNVALMRADFVWTKRAAPAHMAHGAPSAAELFPQGFPTLRFALRALPFKRNKVPIGFTPGIVPNAKITFAKGGIDSAASALLKISPALKLAQIVNDDDMLHPTLKIMRGSPYWSGKFQHPTRGETKFSGVFLQDPALPEGRGLFIGEDDFGTGTQQGATGRVKLGPP